MKNILVILLFAVSTACIAQGPPSKAEPSKPAPPPEEPAPPADGKERVESMKIGFMTQKLRLTPEEAKSFWPLYNKYEDELDQLRKSRHNNLENARKNFDEMPDKDVEKAVDAELAFRQNELDIQKKYHSEFKKVLSIKKVARLYKAEEEFKRHLLERMR